MTDWRVVVGFPAYEVSRDGRVRRSGGKELKAVRHHSGYRQVTLYRRGGRRSIYLHVVVAEAFLGARPTGALVRHFDGDPDHNNAENLRWGTPSQNVHDQVRHGTHHNARRATASHCANGHELTDENTSRRASGRRDCKTGKRRTNAEQYQKRKTRPSALIDDNEGNSTWQ